MEIASASGTLAAAVGLDQLYWIHSLPLDLNLKFDGTKPELRGPQLRGREFPHCRPGLKFDIMDSESNKPASGARAGTGNLDSDSESEVRVRLGVPLTGSSDSESWPGPPAVPVGPGWHLN